MTLIVPPGEPAFPVAVSAEGHFRWLGEKDDPAAALMAVIQTDDGQSWLPLEEFTHRYGWSNDPGRVPTFGP